MAAAVGTESAPLHDPAPLEIRPHLEDHVQIRTKAAGRHKGRLGPDIDRFAALGLNGAALAVLWTRSGLARPVSWLGLALLAYCALLVVGFVGREISSARRPLEIGTDIG